jgi:tetratricopeptide (TPR) repeat protein
MMEMRKRVWGGASIHPEERQQPGIGLQYQGKYEEAEMINRRALDGREKVLGEKHPDTLQSLSSLAFVLLNQGRYEEMEAMNRRALGGREKVLGEEHPDTVKSFNNLASALQRQGKCEEA